MGARPGAYNRGTVTVDAAARYAAMVDAAAQQGRELRGEEKPTDRWDRSAPSFRFDPRRALDANLAVVASYVEPGDVIIEVGGGAGRVGLPLALRCARLINVEPSAGMREQFRASAEAAGIANVEVVPTTWAEAPEMGADLVISEDVTYFVRDIVPFLARLNAAARRRVMLWIWAVPPPNRHARLFEAVYGMGKAPVPGHRDLLAVLWEMGLLPDVRMLPEAFTWPESLPRTRAEAVKFALEQLGASPSATANEPIEGRFEELFARDADVYRPLWRPLAQGMLITWASTSAA